MSPHHSQSWLAGCPKNQKSQVITDPQMDTEGCAGLTRANRNLLRYLWTLFLSSRARFDFGAHCFILQLLSNRLPGVCVAEMERRKWERSSGPQLALSLWLAEVQLDVEYFSFSAATTARLSYGSSFKRHLICIKKKAIVKIGQVELKWFKHIQFIQITRF